MKERGAVREGLLAIALLCCLAPSNAGAVDAGRFGQVRVMPPSEPARGLVILFSDRSGISRDEESAAANLAKAGALVAVIDAHAYLSTLDKSKEPCHTVIGDAEWLSRGLQREYKFPGYLSPIVAGIGEGGTLAELTLSEALPATLAGAVSVDPRAILATRRSLCTSQSKRRTRDGFDYRPPKQFNGFWIVGVTTKMRESDRKYLLELREADASFELDQLGATNPDDALVKLIEPHLASRVQPAGDISRLPLTILPVEPPSKVMAIVLSGDGGWRDLDKTIAEDIQRHGVPVVGWDSLRYFWSRRTPEQTARDLAAVMDVYTQRWNAGHVALIGYSFGADVLPFVYNRLPMRARSQVALISLLAFSKSADFEITISGWLGEPPGEEALAVAPEVTRIAPSLMQCFYGQDESDSDCPALAKLGVETVRTAGGHHFDGNYDALADRILAAIKGRGQNQSASSAR